MRIVHVIASLAPRYGGPSRAVVDMCAGLAARGHEVELLTTDIDGPHARLAVPLEQPIDVGGAMVTYFRVQRPRAYELSLPLGRALAREVPRADVVHVHSLYLFHGLVAGHYARRHNVPYVIRPHGTLNPYHRAEGRTKKAVYGRLVEQRNLDRASAIHCVSEQEARHVKTAGIKAPRYVVPLGVDTDAFGRPSSAEALLARHGELRGRRLITYLGRLTAKKRLDIVLEGFAAAVATEPDLQLVVAGPDDEGMSADLATRARALGIENLVTMLGFIDGPEKVALLQHSLTFVLPSEDENFAVAAVEALAASLPVIVARGVAVSDDVAAAEAGLVVETDVEDVRAAIVALARDRDLATRLGNNARRLANGHFSRAEAARRLEEMYEQVTSR